MKFDKNKLVCSKEYEEIISRLNADERFVVVFPQRLGVSIRTHQTRVCPDDFLTDIISFDMVSMSSLFVARAVLSGGASIPLYYLMDLVGSDINMSAEGVDLVDFASWMAAMFYRQYAGLIEPDLFGRYPDGLVDQLLVSTDTPDLWFYQGERYSSLLFFDPFEGAYCVVRTWIEGFDDVPAQMSEAIDRLSDPVLKQMLTEYRMTDVALRPQLMEKLVKKIRGEI